MTPFGNCGDVLQWCLRYQSHQATSNVFNMDTENRFCASSLQEQTTAPGWQNWQRYVLFSETVGVIISPLVEAVLCLMRHPSL